MPCRCCLGPDAHHKVVVKGKEVMFDFSRMFGPLLVDEEGTPLEKQPISERHPFWKPFNAWMVEWNEQNPERPKRVCETEHLDNRRK